MDLSNYSLLELQQLFTEIQQKLKEPFPNGTVQYKTAGIAKSSYIPYQAYIHRLNTAAGGFWKWRQSINKPIYHEESDSIEMRGILSIVNCEVEGHGFYYLKRDNNKKVTNYDEAIKSAVKNALSDACNFYEMGWIDLKRKWIGNPGVGIMLEEEKSEKICVKCKNNLTTKDEELLNLTKWNQPYCVNDLPDHVKRDLPKEQKAYFGIPL
ncbi:hypothetical protein [Paenibacillus sp. FSL L8-0709]|uniref:hypothetical protein n=1 Tax=Paenibacillus sp. FSL L8-0709 TaxID=2975312 RepID=UPI0030FC06D1